MERLFRRPSHLCGKIFFAGAKNSPGVPNCERFLPARADCRDPIARDPGLIVNDRDLATD